MALPRDDIEGLIDRLEYLKDRAVALEENFRTIEVYCLFIGYPKSGHSLIGAFLDAHPDMVIAHELNCLRCLRTGLSRELIFALSLDISADFHAHGNTWNGFHYRVENQWQGRFRQLRVIGDKKGGGTSWHLLQYPHLLDRLYATLNLPVKFIHVVRHPRNNIAGMSREFNWSLEDAMDVYFAMAESVSLLKARIPGDSLFEIRYETLIQDPIHHLRAICDFLGQDIPADYLEACARLVEPVPRTSTTALPWPEHLLKEAMDKSALFPFLADYRFDL